MNEQFGDSVLRTAKEQEGDPYPEHLELRCHESLLTWDGEEEDFEWTIEEYGHPCRILERSQPGDEHYYTVMLDLDGRQQTRKDVPRSAINFFDVPGTTDIHLPNAFRHPIGIPDEIFPDQWKNLLQQ